MTSGTYKKRITFKLSDAPFTTWMHGGIKDRGKNQEFNKVNKIDILPGNSFRLNYFFPLTNFYNNNSSPNWEALNKSIDDIKKFHVTSYDCNAKLER